MKNKYIPLIVFLLFATLILGFILWKNQTVASLTLDINPSFKINMGTNYKVNNVVALNDDAKSIFEENLHGKTIEEALAVIMDKVSRSSFIHDGYMIVLLSKSGDINMNTVIDTLNKEADARRINIEPIIIDTISEDAKELAKTYHITEAKAEYLYHMQEKFSDTDIEDLSNKPISELKEMNDTGNYCKSGYTLRGSNCEKVIKTVSPTKGKVCPEGYLLYEEKCYAETASTETEELECHRDFKLENGKCYGKKVTEATPNFSCATGDLITRGRAANRAYRDSATDPEEYVCEDKSSAVAPTQRCLTINHTMIDGKCADGPKPLINGGCEPGDYVVNGGCYTMDNGDQWVCPNGDIYEKSKGTYTEKCPDTFKYTKASGSYTCPANQTLNGHTCEKTVTEDAHHKHTCPSGYYLIPDAFRCTNKKDTKDLIDGLVCNEDNARLEDNKCVVYDFMDASHN